MPILLEQGILLALELGIEIFKAVQRKDTVTTTLKHVQRVLEQKIQIDADVDDAANGSKR